MNVTEQIELKLVAHMVISNKKNDQTEAFNLVCVWDFVGAVAAAAVYCNWLMDDAFCDDGSKIEEKCAG